ncbi:hypothetical protein Tco_0759841 [Tanacetum coccineum]
MLHGLVINWSSSAIETSRNRVNGIQRETNDARRSGKFREYQRTEEEEEERRREIARIMAEHGKAKGDEGSREDDSDLESTGSNTPQDLEMDDVDSDDGN